MNLKVKLFINDKPYEIETTPLRRLLDVIRIDIGLTGTKEGCGEGECGACTVIIENEPVNSCLIPVAQVHNKHIKTIEGLAKNNTLHIIQDKLVKLGGTQCGICTPGIALCGAMILEQKNKLNENYVRKQLAGNLCRCTGYQLIIDAIISAKKEMTEQENDIIHQA